jgi:hypothetical protein
MKFYGLAFAKGGQAAFSVKVAAIPEASYQWYKNEAPDIGATNAT